MRLPATLVFGALLTAVASAAYGQVGHVVSVQGTAMVERAGKAARIIGAGEKLEEKDLISVAQSSHAVLELADRTRITLRPNTAFRVEQFNDKGAGQGMVLGLIRGGFRAKTGDIAKSKPESVKFQTQTVVLGIRGTEFDARLCAADCAEEERRTPPQRPRSIAARVIELTGEATATDLNGLQRTLVAGANLEEGDVIATAADTRALVALRDGTKITLTPRSQLAIARFRFNASQPQNGLAHMRLLGGNAHVYTGELGKIGPEAFLFETPQGLIRAQGTGFSVAAGDTLLVHTWDGSVIIQTTTERIELGKTHTGAVSIVGGRITFLPEVPPTLLNNTDPRPDLVKLDPSTFGQSGPEPDAGLYVWVREGAVTLGTGPQQIEVPAGTAVRAAGPSFATLPTVPNFMRFDLTPRPALSSPSAILPFFRRPDGAVTNMCASG